MVWQEYVRQQVEPLLVAGEEIQYTGGVYKMPPVPLLAWLFTKVYFLVITTKRVILLRTKRSLIGEQHQLLNLGNIQFSRNDIKQVVVRKDASASLEFQFADGSRRTFTVHPPHAESVLVMDATARGNERRAHLEEIQKCFSLSY
ncbi:MAG: hypothetical protein QOH88_1961 [Verrucomicrobiota bacterium]|jgi:hypothetical protein